MITKEKVTEIFCIIDEFDKNLNVELSKNLCLPSYNSNGKRCRNRKGRLSESETMTILVCYHFGTYRNFKEYYQNCIRGWLGMNSLLRSPITVLWNSCPVCSLR